MIELTTGAVMQGLLLESNDVSVRIRSNRVETRIPRAQIINMVRLPSIESRYESIRAALGPRDVNERIYWARWLRDRQRYAMALELIREAAAIEPANPEVATLLTWLERHVDILRRRATTGEPTPDRPRAPRPERVDPAPDDDEAFPRLSDDDINIIRVYEYDFADPVRIRIGDDTISRLIQQHADSPHIPAQPAARAELFRRRPTEILEIMFRSQARDLYPEVEVTDHTPAIRRFRDRLHTRWLINGCATSECHGGREAGRFILARDAPRSDHTVYTNLYIVSRFVLDDGTPLVDWRRPADSPLIQLALPRALSARPHPEVPGPGGRDAWRPAFRNANDRAVTDTVNWIRSMYVPRPDYPIDYVPVRPFEPDEGPPTDPERRIER